MKTVEHQEDLQHLLQRVHKQLQSRLSAEVWCKLQQDTLLVLVQHPRADRSHDSQQTLSLVQQALLALPLPPVRQVKLMLRVAGQKQPYADRHFTIKQMSQATATPSTSSPKENINGVFLLGTLLNLDKSPVGAKRWGSHIIKHSKISRRQGWRLTENNVSKKPQSDRNKLSLLLLIASVGIGMGSFFGVVYALTRPCVISRCAIVEKTEQFHKEAAETSAAPKDMQALHIAHSKLVAANSQLEKIPRWSPHHSRAQQLWQTNWLQAQNLQWMLRAMDTALSAAVMSQNPPHPVEKWQEMKLLWQQAIAWLSRISPDSYVYELREHKFQEYGVNLAVINQRLEIEQQAHRQLGEAKKLARIALARQGIAQTVENWQLVQETWISAVQALSSVTKGTIAAQEAQQLLVAYESGLASARDRQTREQFALSTYQEVLRLAEKAKSNSEQQNFSQAVANWRLALAYAQQVPSDSFHYPVVQPLISSYSASLAAASVKLRVALVLQTAREELENSCSGSPRICDYNVTENLIAVQWKPEYVRTVRKTFLTAGNRGDYDTLVNMDEHQDSLRAALQAISYNAGIPLELYDQYGQLKGTYMPMK